MYQFNGLQISQNIVNSFYDTPIILLCHKYYVKHIPSQFGVSSMVLKLPSQ